MTLPTIESSFAVHAASAFIGFEHPDYPALRIALEVLDGTESFLWVSGLSARVTELGLIAGRNIYEALDSPMVQTQGSMWKADLCRSFYIEYVLILFHGIDCLIRLVQSPNSYKAFQEAAKVVKGLCNGSVSPEML